jgi:hypothetical protein
MTTDNRLDQITKTITGEKQQFLARKDLYAHITAFQDAALTIKAVALNAAAVNQCDFSELWRWCLTQIDLSE